MDCEASEQGFEHKESRTVLVFYSKNAPKLPSIFASDLTQEKSSVVVVQNRVV